MSQTDPAALRSLKTGSAPSYSAVPAQLLGDTVAAVPHAKGRVWVRLALVLSVCAVVVGLTAYKYIEDETLRSSIFIERKTTGITSEDAATGICPCQKQWIPWGFFVSLTPATLQLLNTNATSFLQAQCTALIDTNQPELVKLSEVQQALGYVDNEAFRLNYARAAATNLCVQTLLMIVPSLTNATSVDTFTSPFLQSARGAQVAYEIYVGNQVISTLRAALQSFDAINSAALAILSTAACRNDSSAACEAGQLDALSAADSATLASITAGQAALEEVAKNILAAFGGSPSAIDTPAAGNATAGDSIRTLLNDIGVVNWELYKDTCRPAYCDVFRSKDSTIRFTEFLAVVGGLWQSCIFGALVIWCIITSLGLLEDHTYIWH